MSFEIQGKLIEKYDAQQVTDRFRKREFVLETRDNVGANEFVETIKFQLTQDRCDLIDSINVGDDLKVSFNIRGRRWEKNGQVSYFNNLEAWRIEAAAQPDQGETPPPPGMDDVPAEEEPTDDLPF
jgi:hypothetical protein